MCDTWVALRDATTSSRVIFAKNSDRPIDDCQPLHLHARADWPAGAQLDLEYVTIPQVPQTAATLGSGPYWCWGYEEGINEHSVVIGNEAIFTKSFRAAKLRDQAGDAPHLGLLGMDLVRLALERSTSAQEAVQVIGWLVEEYGQYGSGVPGQPHAEGGYDNSFIVADPQEAWVVEAVGRRWAARRVAHGGTSISNQLTIRDVWELDSGDVRAHAESQGWWPTDATQPFDFAHAYSDETVARQKSHARLMRTRQLLGQRQGEIGRAWMQRIARDHYEDTFLGGPYFDAADPDLQSVCMHVSPAAFTWGNTASSCVAELPDNAGAIPVFWWTPGPPCNGCYVPFFVHGSRLPELVSRAGAAGVAVRPADQAPIDTFAAGSYWWRFRDLLDRAKGDAVKSVPGRFAAKNRLIRARFDELEAAFAAELPAVLDAAHQARPDAAAVAAVLDEFTARCVADVLAALDDLADQLE